VQSPEDTVAESIDNTEATNPVDRPRPKPRRPLQARNAPSGPKRQRPVGIHPEQGDRRRSAAVSEGRDRTSMAAPARSAQPASDFHQVRRPEGGRYRRQPLRPPDPDREAAAFRRVSGLGLRRMSGRSPRSRSGWRSGPVPDASTRKRWSPR
jgi:hypothetical protein